MNQEESKIFISYSRKDKDFALRLAEDLRAAGVEIWIDQLDIAPGVRWDDAVEEALDSCKSFMVILSPVSVKSDDVKDEIACALDAGKQIIPVFYQECKIPLRIRRLNYVDFTSDYDSGKTKIIEAMKKDQPLQTESQIVKEEKPKEVKKPVKTPKKEEIKTPEVTEETFEAKTQIPEETKQELETDTKIIPKSEPSSKEEDLSPTATPSEKTASKPIEQEASPEITQKKKKVVTPKPIQISFRRDPKELTKDDVKTMLKKYDFYCKKEFWSRAFNNPAGKGFNHQYEHKSINGDKVVIDSASGLMWQQSGSSMMFKSVLKGAMKWIIGLNQIGYAGYYDWRLPTLEEAMSLMEPENKNNFYIHPIFDSRQAWIWTVDQLHGKSWHWLVDFNRGCCCWGTTAYYYGAGVRAVRSGQSSADTKNQMSSGEWFVKAIEAEDDNQKIRFYTNAIKLDPEYADAYIDRGNAYNNLGQYDEAIQDYNKAIKFYPEYAAAYCSRGFAYYNLGQNDQAIQDFNKAIKLDPKSEATYLLKKLLTKI